MRPLPPPDSSVNHRLVFVHSPQAARNDELYGAARNAHSLCHAKGRISLGRFPHIILLL